jgi:exonuclease III
MKIIAYNIHLSSQEKVDKILSCHADIYVLPEVACPSQIRLPEGFKMEWMGDYSHKGLGVIIRSGLKGVIPGWFNPMHQYFLPVVIDGILILAAWPTTTQQNNPKKYPQIAMEALREYAQHLNEYPCIITGDMNCYKGQAGESKEYSIQTIVDYLDELGFYSAYHKRTGEVLGKESAVTYHHQFKESATFFIDYTFANVPLKTYEVGEWDKNVSDHVPQIIEI